MSNALYLCRVDVFSNFSYGNLNSWCKARGRDSLKKIRVAIFGTGWMGHVHTEALRRLGNIDVVGVAAGSAERARKFADELCIERSTGNYHDFLSDPRIDAVHVCSTNDLHFEQH